jgi:hypothetical protein
MNHRWLLVAGLALVLGGCSSAITVAKLDPNGPPPKGVPWNLAMTQFSLTITRQVISCENALNGKVTVAVSQGKAVDPDHRYVLSSDGIWATTDITSTLATDGTSTGLNAHSEDQTAAIVTNLITTAAQAAVLFGSTDTNLRFRCSEAVRNARAKLDPPKGKGTPLKDIVDADTDAVTAATARVTQLAAAVETDPSAKHALSLASQDLVAKTAQLTEDQAQLNANLKVIQTVQTVVWPLAGGDVAAAHIFRMSQGEAQKWIEWRQPDGTWKAGGPDYMPREIAVDQFDVSLALYHPDAHGGWTTIPRTTAGADIKVGVPVRVAGPGRLLVCTGGLDEQQVDRGPCPVELPADWHPGKNQSIPLHPDPLVLQLGQMYVVPVAGGRFKSEAAVIALDANGNPTSIEIAEKGAVAQAATGTVAQGLTSIAAIPNQVSAARLARTQAETSQINAENALAQAQANSQTSGATAQATAEAALATAQANLATARANAESAGPAGQLALVTAQNNLAVAQAAAEARLANPDALKQIDLANTQTSIFNAQAAQVNAQVALAKAKAALQEQP